DLHSCFRRSVTPSAVEQFGVLWAEFFAADSSKQSAQYFALLQPHQICLFWVERLQDLLLLACCKGCLLLLRML
ncbi:hypothetical protein, partial [Pseudomonas aeruginosa]|uniref:hypothetical protein n=1 Tax=Pseudomonas aeruginosa TaxID=287 RepID=UPI001F2EAA91